MQAVQEVASVARVAYVQRQGVDRQEQHPEDDASGHQRRLRGHQRLLPINRDDGVAGARVGHQQRTGRQDEGQEDRQCRVAQAERQLRADDGRQHQDLPQGVATAIIGFQGP
ncbi:hypothetical protein ACLESD_10125 [Pyxidicoccus sp. 3LFB2]